MQKIVLRTGIVLIVLNTLIGLILSKFSLFNIVTSNLILIIEMGFAIICIKKIMQVGFKIIGLFFNIITGLLVFIIALICPTNFSDNIYLIIGLILLSLQTIFMLLLFQFSQRQIKENK